jgi:hypothetical protein
LLIKVTKYHKFPHNCCFYLFFLGFSKFPALEGRGDQWASLKTGPYVKPSEIYRVTINDSFVFNTLAY